MAGPTDIHELKAAEDNAAKARSNLFSMSGIIVLVKAGLTGD